MPWPKIQTSMSNINKLNSKPKMRIWKKMRMRKTRTIRHSTFEKHFILNLLHVISTVFMSTCLRIVVDRWSIICFKVLNKNNRTVFMYLLCELKSGSQKWTELTSREARFAQPFPLRPWGILDLGKLVWSTEEINTSWRFLFAYARLQAFGKRSISCTSLWTLFFLHYDKYYPDFADGTGLTAIYYLAEGNVDPHKMLPFFSLSPF